MKKHALFVTILVLMLVTAPAALSVTFTKSIEQAGAPALLVNADGFVGTITDESGNTVNIPKGEITITSLIDAHKKPDSEASKELIKAYEDIKNMSSISDLGINKASLMDDLGIEDESQMTVLSVIDITATGETAKLLEKGGIITITLDTKLPVNQPRVILHLKNAKWKALDAKDVVANKDGSTTITLRNGLSPFAIIVKNDSVPAATEPEPEKEKGANGWLIGGGAAAVAAIGGGAFLLSKKKKTSEANIYENTEDEE